MVIHKNNTVMSRTILFFFGSLFMMHLTVNAQELGRLDAVERFAAGAAGYLEGFSESTGSNDFIYHSFRSDLSECLLTRATSGEMHIEWVTRAVCDDFEGEGLGFVWIAAIDITDDQHIFDVEIDGIKRFEISSGSGDAWHLTTDDGGTLSFVGVETDMHGDSHGYMALWAPAAWLVPGEPLSLRITGRADRSNTWVIVYKAPDASNYLQESVKYNRWVNLDIEMDDASTQFRFRVPQSYAGKELDARIGDQSYPVVMSRVGDAAAGTLQLTKKLAADEPITLSDGWGNLLDVRSALEEGSTSQLSHQFILRNDVVIADPDKIKVSSRRLYTPRITELMVALAGSNLGSGTILLMISSHQDIAWMDSPEKCIIERDTMLLTPLFERTARDPHYRFDIEQALMLKEYVHRHPGTEEMISELLLNGQISCGSSYNQPYEEVYSGESLVRQFYFGTRWLREVFGYTADTYYNKDVPGRTLQMPQILKKSGTKNLVASRMEAGMYKWFSPDGSYVTTYSPGHYSYAYQALQSSFFNAAEMIAGTSLMWEEYFDDRSDAAVIPLLSDWDMSPPNDYTELIDQWNSISELEVGGEYIPVTLPPIKMALAPEFMGSFRQAADTLKHLSGERPPIWLYIHGPGHQRAIAASREGDILLPALEKFATANALVDGTFRNYPADRLRETWEAKIYPDHGWGGKNGDITDALFKQKYLFARSEARHMLEITLREISSKIDTDGNKGMPVVVFNSLGWERSDPASFRAFFDQSEVTGLQLTDGNGRIVPFQLSDLSYYDDQSMRSATVTFIASNVPSIGYKTYYLVPGGASLRDLETEFDTTYENRFFRIGFGDGGLTSIYDKELQMELVDTEKFKAGEVFAMNSEGTGAGEFSDLQHPDMFGFDRAANYEARWQVTETGDVYTSFVNRQPIRNAVIEQTIILYDDIRRIDFQVDLLNYEGVLYREYRMAIPLNMEGGQVSYEVPFGVVDVGRDEIRGAAGERHTAICKELHPRGIENWIGASDDRFGVTLSSSVAVADYIDPTDDPAANIILQPLLLASRRSCHHEGNEYLQPGDHHFRFSFYSHQPGWSHGFRSGRQSNEALMVVAGARPYAGARLPGEMSFFGLGDDNNNLIITTVKKAEDSEGVVVRLFDIEGRETEAHISAFTGIDRAARTNLVEFYPEPANVENGRVILSVGKYAIETLLLEPR